MGNRGRCRVSLVEDGGTWLARTYHRTNRIRLIVQTEAMNSAGARIVAKLGQILLLAALLHEGIHCTTHSAARGRQ